MIFTRTSVCATLVVGAACAAGAANMVRPGLPSTQPAQAPVPAHGERQRAEGEIAQVAFLAGTWTGTKGGAHVEEIWSAPSGNCVMGCFRWMRPDGTAMMYEMLAITAEPDGVRLRLRHYSAGLVGKESPDRPVTLRMTKAEAGRAEFAAEKDAGDLAGVTYVVSDDRLKIEVAFVQQGEKPRKPLVFDLTRAGSSGAGKPAATGQTLR